MTRFYERRGRCPPGSPQFGPGTVSCSTDEFLLSSITYSKESKKQSLVAFCIYMQTLKRICFNLWCVLKLPASARPISLLLFVREHFVSWLLSQLILNDHLQSFFFILSWCGKKRSSSLHPKRYRSTPCDSHTFSAVRLTTALSLLYVSTDILTQLWRLLLTPSRKSPRSPHY